MRASGCPEGNFEVRLVRFSVSVIDLLEALPDHHVADHIAGRLLRSGGLAEEGVPAVATVLKELQETCIWLNIIRSRSLAEAPEVLDAALEECNQLMTHAYALSSGH